MLPGPSSVSVKAKYSPLGFVSVRSWSGVVPIFFANPAAAPCPADFGGPSTALRYRPDARSSPRPAEPAGAGLHRCCDSTRTLSAVEQIFKHLPVNGSSAGGIIQSGISSVPISSRNGQAHAATPAPSTSLATPNASFRTRPITPTRSVTLMAPRESSRLKRCEHFST